jgi:hypothetical protein
MSRAGGADLGMEVEAGLELGVSYVGSAVLDCQLALAMWHTEKIDNATNSKAALRSVNVCVVCVT